MSKLDTFSRKMQELGGALILMFTVPFIAIVFFNSYAVAGIFFVLGLLALIGMFAKDENKDKVSTNTSDSADQIKKLAELKEQGILTEEEFSKKKEELLAKI